MAEHDFELLILLPLLPKMLGLQLCANPPGGVFCVFVLFGFAVVGFVLAST